MRDHFFNLAQRLCARLQGDEVLTLGYAGEASDFVRFNQGRVRQAGHVRQAGVSMHLIQGTRHAILEQELRGALRPDLQLLSRQLEELRACLPQLPEDPHLLYATGVQDSEWTGVEPPPDATRLVRDIIDAAEGLDLVGVLACGPMEHGFANSLGQRNWHSANSFNLDWSCYLQGDKAVKAHYAGRGWNPEALRRRMQRVRGNLEVMARPPVSLKPGRYRAYLAPAALREILDLLAWESFGLKAHRSAETPLLRMVREGARLHPAIHLSENNALGIAPDFTADGFVKPRQVRLIHQGIYRDCLVGPRSAREYGLPVTGDEVPETLDLAAGDLTLETLADSLGTGLWINNLWYCNFSDHHSCRITGMTRFACLWVEQGEVVAPVNVMRFDESLYHLLGDGLIGLTRERELLLDSHTYGARSSGGCRLPGALVDGLRLTL
jgi:predicted Zn-dependent protease